jgi:hypothetical protein
MCPKSSAVFDCLNSYRSVSEEITHVDVDFFFLGFLLLGFLFLGGGAWWNWSGSGSTRSTSWHWSKLSATGGDQFRDALTLKLLNHDFQVLLIGGDTDFFQELCNIILTCKKLTHHSEFKCKDVKIQRLLHPRLDFVLGIEKWRKADRKIQTWLLTGLDLLGDALPPRTSNI